MNEKGNERLKPIEQYEILRVLGRGGTSVVYLVADRTDGKTYAMKVLRKGGCSKPEIIQQTEAELQTEAGVLRALCNGRHEHDAGWRSIPKYRECVCDENGGFAGFVMEYVEGRSLRQILEEGRVYSVREAAEAGVQLCTVLGRLHRMDPPIIYRDLKPANILVRSDGTWVVVDFGAVRKYKTGAGKDTDRLGTEGYAAPEQYGGWEQSDERTDVYGIGAVLHHMITGRPPLETGLKTLEEFGAPAGGERFPRHYSYMAKILLRCCSVTPSMRYSSCAELEKALRDVIRLCDKAGRRANEADGIWRKFILLVGAAGIFLVCSGMLAVSSAEAGMKGYRILIEKAQAESGLDKKTESYRRAVRARPEEPEAHLAFLRELAQDYVITQEERDALESALFAENSLGRMREKRPGEYARLEMELGWVYFACYEGGTEAAGAAFRNAGQTAGWWFEGRQAAAAMGVVLGEVWTGERIDAWRALERTSIKEAFRTGEGIYAAAVCKAAVTEIALFPDRYERGGADEEVIKEVTETAVKFEEEAEKGRLRVPDRIREELRAAVESLRREERPAE